MEETQEVPPTELTEQPTDAPTELTPTQNPTRDVKTFWNRLDEVLEQLETEVPMTDQKPYKSAIFQPDRIVLSSHDDPTLLQTVYNSAQGGHQRAETFSSFKIRFSKSLIGVKSIQLLSCIIPAAISNIPDDELFFFFYRLRNLTLSLVGAWSVFYTYIQGDVVSYGGSFYVSLIDSNLAIIPSANPSVWYNCSATMGYPNMYDLKPANINSIYLNPTFINPQEATAAANVLSYNRTFASYQDLVNSLNFCVSNGINNDGPGAVGASFAWDPTTNKIQFIPQASQIAAGYFFLPCGYSDPNILQYLTTDFGIVSVNQNPFLYYRPGYSLNLRLGFTWNGAIPSLNSITNAIRDSNLAQAVYWYLRPYPPYASAQPWAQNLVTANNYGNLVYSNACRVFCNVTFGSAEDSGGQAGLLSVVPLNTGTLGISYYQNNFNRPLTKLPEILPDIEIRLVTDSGAPYILPNSASVTLELAIEYK
jgi:hypothetical protein